MAINTRGILAATFALAATVACGGGQFDDADEYAADYGYDNPADFPTEMADYKDVFDASGLPVAMAEGQVGATSAFDSKFLGVPYMPKGFDYPVDPDGRPLSFLAQVNFADVPSLPDYPDSGILQFYISNDDDYTKHAWGLQFYKDKPYNAQAQFDLQQSQEYFRVVWHEDVTTDESNLDNRVPRISGGYLPIDDEAKLTFTLGSSFPTPDDYRFAKIYGEDAYTFFDRFGQDSGDVFDRYYSHVAPRSIAWIGGYAYFTQSDPREIEPDEDWVLLFKIQSSVTFEQPAVMWGDTGVGGFFIRRADLRRKDFSRVLYAWDSY